jgi:ABC-2 type transport system permease protein
MRALTIFKAVTKNWIRSRTGLFFSILFPVLLLLVFGAIFGGIGGSSKSNIYIQNLDTVSGKPSDLSMAYVGAVNDTGLFNVKDIPLDSDPVTYVRTSLGPLGGNMRILIISNGFHEQFVNGTLKIKVGISYTTLNTTFLYYAQNLTDSERILLAQGLVRMQQFYETLPGGNASLTIMLDASDQSGSIIKSVLMSVASAFNYQMIGAENVVHFTDVPVTATQFSTIDFYVPGITAAFIMTNGIIALTSNTTEFKRRGVIKRLSITPLTKMDWILGNVLSQTVLNLMLTALMIVLGWVIFNVRIIPDVLTIVLIFLGSVMFSGIGMILSGVVKDVEAASAIGNAIAFPMMFLSGAYFPMEFMPSYIQTIAKALPLTYFADGLRYSMIYKYPEGVYTNMAIVGVLAIIFLVLGSIVTRWKEK